jgi:hypothetical protein
MIKLSKHPIMQHKISLRYGWWPKVHITWEHHNPIASGWVAEIWDQSLLTDIFHHRTAHSCLRFFPYLSTRPRSNPRPGQVRFHHSSNKSGTFPFWALTQSCSLENHYVWDVMSGHSWSPIFRGGGGRTLSWPQGDFSYSAATQYMLGQNIRKPWHEGPRVNSLQFCHLLWDWPHLVGYIKYEIEFCSWTFPIMG